MLQRKNVRVTILILAEVYEPTTNELIAKGRFIDLSAGGALFKSDKPIEKDHLYTFKFEVKDRYKFMFSGKSTYSKEIPDNRVVAGEKKWITGIQFQCTPLEKEKMERIVDSIHMNSFTDLEKLGVYWHFIFFFG
ncbi:MAG: PilZ domain-containing protein [Elusimicrobiota bacterium]